MSTENAVEQVINRLRAEIGAENDADLARLLGVTRSSISAWKRRGAVPPKYLLKHAVVTHSSNRAWSQVQEGYAFALVGFAARKLFIQAQVGNEFQNELWQGQKLKQLYWFFEKELGVCPDKQSLTSKYQELRQNISQDDWLEWIEALE